MPFTHMATAYILRWNQPDYNEIIGVFLTEKDLQDFMREHFTPEECADAYLLNKSLEIELGRYYERMK